MTLLDLCHFSGNSLLKSDVIGIYSLDPDPVEECILSSLSGIPLFRLHDQETTKVKHFGFCDKLITMSANFFSYAEATDQILRSFQWKKIALIFEGKSFISLNKLYPKLGKMSKYLESRVER